MNTNVQTVLSTAPTPSWITLPPQPEPLPGLLDFFDQRFPFVGREVWLERLQQGKISDEQGRAVDADTPYRINARLSYFREVEHEPVIPFREQVLYQDEDILIVDKPHFLPVTPSGRYVNECLLHRLRRASGNDELVAVHRLDRETAGLVLFSCRKQSRHRCFELFREQRIKKSYQAVASLPHEVGKRQWHVESRIVRGTPWLRFCNTNGEINARSVIRLQEIRGDQALFHLEPLTGKTHQLRLHMQLIGSNIVGDRFYPDFQPPSDPPDYTSPLQLLAKHLAFKHPISGEFLTFTSQLSLQW